jgi:LysM repeat protein
LRAQRLALIGGIALAIALTPALTVTVLAAEPTVVVQPGDTLTSIARRHGVSVRRLAELNDLADPNRIFSGQQLRVAGRGSRGSDQRAASAQRKTIHVVSRGSTLWGIAGHYGVSVSSIVAANRIANPSRIFVGQRLVIPSANAPASGHAPQASARRGSSPPQQRASRVHVVSRGSTLWGIAGHYGVSVSSIVTANRIANPSRIFVGQRLVIPGAKTPASGHAPRARMSSRMAAIVADRASIRRMIVREADRHGVPRRLALAVAWQESGWQQGVVSHAGAVGVMQLMPATAEWVGQTMLGHPVRITDAHSNISAGIRLLRHYLNRYDGNRDLVLAAYYQGQHAVDHYGVYAVSRPYIASVRYLERLFGG